jgi:hypothetical protein
MVFKVGNVTNDANNAVSDFVHHLIDDVLSPTCNDDLRAFLCKQARSCLADAAVAAGNDGHLVFQMLHCLSPFSGETKINVSASRH